MPSFTRPLRAGATHGRLYRLEDELHACPSGWRVPTEDDWRGLAGGRW